MNLLLSIQQAAQEAVETMPELTQLSEVQEPELSMWELSLKGGIIMIPLLLLSILAVYITLIMELKNSCSFASVNSPCSVGTNTFVRLPSLLFSSVA